MWFEKIVSPLQPNGYTLVYNNIGHHSKFKTIGSTQLVIVNRKRTTLIHDFSRFCDENTYHIFWPGKCRPKFSLKTFDAILLQNYWLLKNYEWE